MPAQRVFTIAEANALVPFLTETMTALQRLYRESKAAHREVQLCEAVGQGADGRWIMEVDHREATERLHRAVEQMKSLIQQVHEHGCQIKHLEMGLVDFPSRLFGEEVLLCWKLGEPSIEYYHGTADGFAGRRRIPPDILRRAARPRRQRRAM
ncbi:DUF2203 domain-containing protein [Carboxydochorda subterranea]|uniref:DUF2203 domain-containing protein n=1 Tax=Carboxydichorda subterranea TaxID=3109565 RepID=A0ABZ1BW11_9FIRM|nr:DUF2203 domain-containing protein [Limnochorda sp. L945t]WRP16974.1 DUF2203 domain-containing protein [Limnochorda sp. L945t]